MSDFEEFEADVADVPDAFEERPGITVEAALVEHLAELVAHIGQHVMPHLHEAQALGHDTISYTTKSGAEIAVRISHTKFLIQFSISPDRADDIIRGDGT